MSAYETVIGLEIHVQLATRSKLFSAASTRFGAAPNTQACPVDLGLPGALPVLNAGAVRMAVTFGLAIGAEISRRCTFDRKNYFYPDLPKGYQISQMAQPIVGRGSLDYRLPDGSERQLTIHHAHLEEDAGKSIHTLFPGQSGIDLNRAGTPLLEIVTEPELRSAAEAVAFLKRLHALVRYLGISDGNMNEGSFRCDVNVSLRPVGASELVNTLMRVSDQRDLRARRDQLFKDCLVQRADVLGLVDQDMGVAPHECAQNGRLLEQHAMTPVPAQVVGVCTRSAQATHDS